MTDKDKTNIISSFRIEEAQNSVEHKVLEWYREEAAAEITKLQNEIMWYITEQVILENANIEIRLQIDYLNKQTVFK